MQKASCRSSLWLDHCIFDEDNCLPLKYATNRNHSEFFEDIDEWCPLSGLYIGPVVNGDASNRLCFETFVPHKINSNFLRTPIGSNENLPCSWRRTLVSSAYPYDSFDSDRVKSGAMWKVYINFSSVYTIQYVAEHSTSSKTVTKLIVGEEVLDKASNREFVTITRKIAGSLISSCRYGTYCHDRDCVVPHCIAWEIYRTDKWVDVSRGLDVDVVHPEKEWTHRIFNLQGRVEFGVVPRFKLAARYVACNSKAPQFCTLLMLVAGFGNLTHIPPNLVQVERKDGVDVSRAGSKMIAFTINHLRVSPSTGLTYSG
jgi:hypothetical protein